MKKLFLTLALLTIAIPCFGATANWDYTGTADGFTLYWWETSNPAVQWNLTAPSGATRTLNLLDAWFKPATEYSFGVEAYNTVGKSGMSNIATYVTEAPAYTPPGDLLPPEIIIPDPPNVPSGFAIDEVSVYYKFIPVP